MTPSIEFNRGWRVFMRKSKFRPTWGRIKYSLEIESIVNENIERSKRSTDDKKRLYYSGIADGLIEGNNISHRKAIDLLVDIKNEIKEMETFNLELFEFEIGYKQGFKEGIERILGINRSYFEKSLNLIILGFSDDEELINKYNYAMLHCGFEEYSGNVDCDSFFFSTDIITIKNLYNEFRKQELELIIIMFTSGKNATLERIKVLDAVEPIHLFIIRDREEINVHKMIEKVMNCCDLG